MLIRLIIIAAVIGLPVPERLIARIVVEALAHQQAVAQRLGHIRCLNPR